MEHEPQSPNESSKWAVVTLCVGDFYNRMGEITHPLMEEYATKCGADFIVINERKVNSTYGLDERYEKFQLYELIDIYDRIVFIDTDILVSPYTPSLFERVSPDQFAAASEEGFSKASRDKKVTQDVLGTVDWKNPYFNSGMMVISKRHKEIFDPTRPELKLWSTGEFRKKEVNLLNDQPYLNHRLNELGVPLVDLGHRFNHTRVIKETHTRFNSYMIHYAGPSGHRYGSRLEQLNKDARVFASPLNLKFSRLFPAYRWVADRMDPAFFAYLKEKFAAKPSPKPM